MATLAFLLKRFVAQRLLGLAVVVALAFTIGVLVAGPIYADAAREAILSSTLRAQDVTTRNVRFSVYGSAGFDQSGADRAVASTVEGLPVSEIVPQALSSAALKVGTSTPREVPLLSRAGAAAHLTLKGAAPDIGEVAIATGLMAALHDAYGLEVGDEITLAGPGGDEVLLRITGRYDPPNPDDPFWYGSLSPFPAPDSTQPSPLLLSPEGFTQVEEQLGASIQYSWDVFLDLSRLPFERAQRVPGLIERAATTLRGAPGFSSLQTTTGLAAIIELVRQRVSNLRAPVLLVVFQIGAVALAVLLGVGSLVLTRQSFELAVLRSRGFSRAKLLAVQGAQALIAAAVAFPLGLLFGMALAWLASNSNGRTLPGVLFPIRLTGEAAWLGLATAIVGACALLLLSLPHMRRTILEERRLLSREDQPLLARFPVELIVLPLGVFAFAELRSHGVTTSFERGSFDPLVLLAPTLLIFGLSFLALRLLLLALRASDRAVRRTRSLPTYLAARRLGRSPGTSFATSLLLVLSVGLVLVSSSYRTVVSRSHQDSAHQQVGADWLVGIGSPERPLAALRRIPSGSTPVVRTNPTFARPSAATTGTVALAIDPGTYAQGGWWRDDYSEVPLATWLDELSSPPGGAPLSGGGELALTLDAPQEAEGLHLIATVATRTGDVRALDLGALRVGAGRYSAPIPEDAVRLLCLSLVQEGTEDLPAELPFEIAGAIGTQASVELSGWQPLRWRGSDAELAAQGGGLLLTIHPGAGHVIGGIVPPSDPIPAMVSPALASTQPAIFSATLGGQRLEFRRVAVAENFPSVVGGFMVVSAPALLEATARVPELGLGLTEVWAMGEDPRPALRDAGFLVASTTSAEPIVRYLSQLPQSLAVGMYFTAAVGGLGLVVIGVAVGLYFAQRRREYEFASLRAMGTGPRHIRRTLVLEQGTMVVFAVVAGGAIALWILELMMPYMGRTLAAAFPTPRLAFDGVSLGVALAAIALATAIGLSLATRELTHASITSVLRGEAE